jgi:hypothetical protein
VIVRPDPSGHAGPVGAATTATTRWKGATVGQGGAAGSDPRTRRQHAGFSIFLDQVLDPEGRQHWETRLYHAESDAESTLAGVLPEGWIEWIFQRIGSGETGSRSREASRAVLEVEDVEIVDVAMEEGPETGEPRHTITAQVVVRLIGVARVERAIGSEVLRGIARSAPRTEGRKPAT